MQNQKCINSMLLKNKIAILASAVVTFIVLLLTLKLSGHTQSLGLLVLGLFCVYFIAILIVVILATVKAIKRSVFLVFTAILIVSFASFFIYHQSYDSYNETRTLLWGFNGETKSTIESK